MLYLHSQSFPNALGGGVGFYYKIFEKWLRARETYSRAINACRHVTTLLRQVKPKITAPLIRKAFSTDDPPLIREDDTRSTPYAAALFQLTKQGIVCAERLVANLSETEQLEIRSAISDQISRERKKVIRERKVNKN